MKEGYRVLHTLLGLSMLLGGIFVMRWALKKALWRRLHAVLRGATRTPWRGLLLGTAAAALFQSSTTVCLITIGLVSAEYITFRKALGIILGANIGTCSTVQLVNLSIPSEYLFPAILIAILLSIYRKFRYFGIAAAGILCMFAGLNHLTEGIAGLSRLDQLTSYVVMANSQPMYGIWGGILLTTAFQSSSAATALVMVLADEGLLTITTAAYLVYGNNIGSCVSSVVFSAAAPIAARRVALAHILLNLLGVAVFYPLTPAFVWTVSYLSQDFSEQVAMLHTLFNLLSSLIGLVLIHQFAGLVERLTPGHFIFKK
jgi:phosphate:Na+ symporter